MDTLITQLLTAVRTFFATNPSQFPATAKAMADSTLPAYRQAYLAFFYLNAATYKEMISSLQQAADANDPHLKESIKALATLWASLEDMNHTLTEHPNVKKAIQEHIMTCPCQRCTSERDSLGLNDATTTH